MPFVSAGQVAKRRPRVVPVWSPNPFSRPFKPIPRDVIGVFEFWLKEQDAADASPVPLGGPYPMLIASAVEFYDDVKRHAEPSREILEPELIRAVDDLSWHVGQAMQWHDFTKAPWAKDPADLESHALAHTVEGALQFAIAFRDHGDPTWLEVMELTVDAAASHRDLIVQQSS